MFLQVGLLSRCGASPGHKSSHCLRAGTEDLGELRATAPSAALTQGSLGGGWLWNHSQPLHNQMWFKLNLVFSTL